MRALRKWKNDRDCNFHEFGNCKSIEFRTKRIETRGTRTASFRPEWQVRPPKGKAGQALSLSLCLLHPGARRDPLLARDFPFHDCLTLPEYNAPIPSPFVPTVSLGSHIAPLHISSSWEIPVCQQFSFPSCTDYRKDRNAEWLWKQWHRDRAIDTAIWYSEMRRLSWSESFRNNPLRITTFPSVWIDPHRLRSLNNGSLVF